MEKLYAKLDALKKALDETDCIKELKKLNHELKSDDELTKLIEEYNYKKAERIKECIINNELFRKYKHQEAELNLLILEINCELKKITKKDN